MGMFGSLFGGKPELKPHRINYVNKLPGKAMQKEAKRNTLEAVQLFGNVARGGETDTERALNKATRTDTLRDFDQFIQNSAINMHRKGMGSSGASDARFAKISEALLSEMTRQDAMREAALLSRRMNAATRGTNTVLNLGGASIPSIEESGNFFNTDFGKQLDAGLTQGSMGGIGGLMGGGGKAGMAGGFSKGVVSMFSV